MAYTTINDPSAYFQTALYTGNGNASSRAITNDGHSNLRPDWLWIKIRSAADNHVLLDSNRGVTKQLKANGNDAEDTVSHLASFNTDGFNLTSTDQAYNANSQTYAAWQWAAGGATPSKTYRVVVVSDSGNKYRFRNSANTATFAQSAVTLELQSGGTYTFDQSDSTVASHPMKFSTTSDGTHGGGSSYNTGVTYKLDGSTVTESAYVSGFASATTRQIILNVQNTTTLYYYCHYHSGMGGQADQNATFGQTNFDGSILSRSTENTTAGFSIVRYTGTATGGATIGHGLGVAPKLVITKTRAISDNWLVYHAGIGATNYLTLNTDSAKGTSSGAWNDTAPSSTVVTLGSFDNSNDNDSMIAYCFAEKKGYSKFGTYNGNNNADGTFVYTGFKPAFIILKNSERTQNWRMYDLKRPGFNSLASYASRTNYSLRPNSNSAENLTNQLDILSNGFKFRSSDGDSNGYNENHIYWAFAEHPFVASNNVAATAR